MDPLAPDGRQTTMTSSFRLLLIILTPREVSQGQSICKFYLSWAFFWFLINFRFFYLILPVHMTSHYVTKTFWEVDGDVNLHFLLYFNQFHQYQSAPRNSIWIGFITSCAYQHINKSSLNGLTSENQISQWQDGKFFFYSGLS